MIDDKAQEEEIHLNQLMHVLVERKRAFFITFCIIVVGAVLYTFLMSPVYEANSSLLLQDDKSKSGIFGELMMSEVSPIESEIAILNSRTVTEETVRRTHLNWRISEKSDGLSFKIKDFAAAEEEPLFGLIHRATGFKVEVLAPDSYRVLDRDGNDLGKGKPGELLYTNRLRLLLSDLTGKPGDSFSLELLSFNKVVENLRKAVQAQEQTAKSNILAVSYQNNDPDIARSVVNTLVQAYLEKRVSFNNEAAGKTANFISQQFGAVEKDLDAAENKLSQYKVRSGIVALDQEAQGLLAKITDAEKGRAEAVIREKQAEFALSAARDALAKGKPYSPYVLADDPVLAGLTAKLADLQVQKSALVAEYTDAHPAVVDVKEQIAEIQKKIVATLETSLKNTAKNKSSLAEVISSYEAYFRKLPVAERELAKLMRYSKVNSDIYSLLLQKREEARIAEASTISNLNIVDPAILPYKPVKPKKLLYILLGLCGGFMMGIFVAFFQEYLDDTIKDVDMAKRELGTSLMAVIPYFKAKHINGEEKIVKSEGVNKEKEMSLIVYHEPKSQVSEVFRSLRTAIRFSASADKRKQVVLITSSFPGEGKSTISSNLAVTLALTGEKVVLLDCDLRRATLHEKFGITDKVLGMSDVLVGDVTIEKAVRKTELPGLEIITAGTTPPNPAEILGSEKVRTLINSLRGTYDHIILDAPPVLAVTDTPLLTAMVDMVLVVIESGRVPVGAARHLRETLTQVGAPVAGFVMNDKKVSGGRTYGYSYKYGAYYGEEKTAEKKPWWKKLLKRD